jgi:hypothetical protein
VISIPISLATATAKDQTVSTEPQQDQKEPGPGALAELGAMNAAYSSFRELDAPAQDRAMSWLRQRLNADRPDDERPF